MDAYAGRGLVAEPGDKSCRHRITAASAWPVFEDPHRSIAAASVTPQGGGRGRHGSAPASAISIGHSVGSRLYHHGGDEGDSLLRIQARQICGNSVSSAGHAAERRHVR
jgi:hypothetical protein